MSLSKAVFIGDLETARRLLADDGYDVNEYDHRDIESRTALMWAVESVTRETDQYGLFIKQLFKHPKFNINTQLGSDNLWHGLSALHCVCRFDIESSVGAGMLLRHYDINVNITDKSGQTPLMDVVQRTRDPGDTHAQVLTLLLDHPNINVNIEKKDGRCALYLACRFLNSTTEATRLIVSSGKYNFSLTTNGLYVLGLLLYSINERKNTAEIVKDCIDIGHVLLKQHTAKQMATMLNVSQMSALVEYLDKSHDLHHYKANQLMIDGLEMLLSCPKSVHVVRQTLAIAITQRSFQACERILKSGANISSAFEDNETALHCALRLDSLRKTQLLMKYGPDLNTRWRGLDALEFAISNICKSDILELLCKTLTERHGFTLLKKMVKESLSKCCALGETPLECATRLRMQPWISFLQNQTSEEPQENLFSKCSTKLKVNNHVGRRKELALTALQTCRLNFIRHPREVRHIFHFIVAVLQKVSKKVSNLFAFIPVLAGSMAENTKCYTPNEFDFVCLFMMKDRLQPDSPSSAWYQAYGEAFNPCQVAQDFYREFDAALKKVIQEESQLSTGPLRLLKHSLQLRDKISCLRILYKEEPFKNMVIYVDLVPAFPMSEDQLKEHSLPRVPLKAEGDEIFLIAKASRHDFNPNLTKHSVSYSRVERSIIQKLPYNARKGLIFAKASRIEDIARPVEPLSSFDLEEDIPIDDLLTSYMLKTCLFNLLPEDPEELCDDTPSGWAIRIYSKLEGFIEGRRLFTWGSTIIDCGRCEVERGCCKKRKLMLATTRQIIQWLKVHQAEINNIDLGDLNDCFTDTSRNYLIPQKRTFGYYDEPGIYTVYQRVRPNFKRIGEPGIYTVYQRVRRNLKRFGQPRMCSGYQRVSTNLRRFAQPRICSGYQRVSTNVKRIDEPGIYTLHQRVNTNFECIDEPEIYSGYQRVRSNQAETDTIDLDDFIKRLLETQGKSDEQLQSSVSGDSLTNKNLMHALEKLKKLLSDI